MPTKLISPEARQRLKAQQAKESEAVAAHASACVRLDEVRARRADVISAQDHLVASAEVAVAVAAAGVVRVSGFVRAAAILGLAPADLRRLKALANQQGASPQQGDD